MDDIKWFEENEENEDGIISVAFTELDEELKVGRIVGYNGIVTGDKVEYKNELYTVVMVSRMGDFGLSKTGKLPYIIRVQPKFVKKISE